MIDSVIHAAEGALQAYLDGELPDTERARLRAHLDECETCAAELASLRENSDIFRAALDGLDGVAPARGAGTRRAAEGGAAAVHPIAGARSRAGRGLGRWSALPRAAVLVLGFAAAASAAIPGSPVRGWVESVFRGDERAAVPTAEELDPAGVAAPADPMAEAGVTVSPEDGVARVQIEGAGAGLEVIVLLTDGDRLGVYGSGPAAEARFAAAPGRVMVTEPIAGTLRLEIPREVSSALVELNGSIYVVKDGDRLRIVGGRTDSSGIQVRFTVE